MTDRALWAAAQEDYTNALKIAEKAWSDAGHAGVEDSTIQAAAATVLIHITKLRSETHIHVKVPQSAAPSPTEVKTATQSGAVPPCPACGGEMWDNRGKKKNPKAADFTCKQKNGECMSKGYKTGVWLDKLPSRSKPVPAGSFDDMPPALDEGEDSLPF